MRVFRLYGWRVVVDVQVSNDGLWGLTSIDDGARYDDLAAIRIVHSHDAPDGRVGGT